MNIMQLLTEYVQQKIRHLLPEVFALVFDRSTFDQTHYLGIFVTFPYQESELGYKKVLLSFSPMTDEESLRANAHVSLFEFILGFCNKTWGNVAALIGDNYSTNKSFAVLFHWMCKSSFQSCRESSFGKV
jgi:hypothetical protein